MKMDGYRGRCKLLKQKGSHGCLKKLAKSEMKSERSYNLVIIVMIVAVIVLAAVYMTVSLSMKKPMKIAAKAPLVEVPHITTTTGKKQDKKRHKKLTPYRLAMIYFGQDRKKQRPQFWQWDLAGSF